MILKERAEGVLLSHDWIILVKTPLYWCTLDKSSLSHKLVFSRFFDICGNLWNATVHWQKKSDYSSLFESKIKGSNDFWWR